MSMLIVYYFCKSLASRVFFHPESKLSDASSTGNNGVRGFLGPSLCGDGSWL